MILIEVGFQDHRILGDTAFSVSRKPIFLPGKTHAGGKFVSQRAYEKMTYWLVALGRRLCLKNSSENSRHEFFATLSAA